MKVLLLYPEFPDTFWSFKHALKFIRKKAVSPPLGLLTIAPMLPDTWEKRLLDLNVTSLTEDDLTWADAAFISGMTVQRQSAHQAIEACKNAGLTVVAGGPLFTTEHQDFNQVDHFVMGEAECSLPPFLADLQGGQPEQIYSCEGHPDLESTPIPEWDLLDMRQYSSMSIQYSRGCPYHCEFCNVTALLGHRPRVKSANQVLAELDALYEGGWREGIFFVDDNFIGHRKHLKNDLLPALVEWRKTHQEITFYTQVSINLADDESLIHMMTEAGFNQVFVGIETPDELGLKEAKKSHNQNRNLLNDVRRLHRAGLQVQGGFIVGFDSDSPSIFERQIQFIQRSGIVVSMVGLLQAPVGTKLHERLQKAKRLLGNTSGDNVDGSTNIIPLMGLETLRQGYHSIIRTIYSPKHYYQRVKTFLQDYSPSLSGIPVDGAHIMAFLRSVYHLGIKGKERLQYWKLLGWTLLRRPKLFPTAVTMTIYGYHFRKIAELHVL